MGAAKITKHATGGDSKMVSPSVKEQVSAQQPQVLFSIFWIDNI